MSELDRRASLASLWMVGSGLSFTAMAALIKISSRDGVPFPQVVFYRGLIAFLLAWAVLRIQGEPLIGNHWRAQAVRGMIGIVGVFSYTAGVVLLPIASAVTLNYTSPLLLAATMLVQARQPPSWPLVLALAGGFLGVVLMLQPSYDSGQWLGIAASLTSALTAVAAAMHIRTLARLRESAWRTVAWFSGSVALAAFPGYVASSPAELDWHAGTSVLAMGVAGALGQGMLTLAYQRGHALTVSLLGYSQVVFTTLLGIVLWQDHPGLATWFGIALIVASGALSTTFMGRVNIGKPPTR